MHFYKHSNFHFYSFRGVDAPAAGTHSSPLTPVKAPDSAPAAAPRQKSPETNGRKSVTSLGSMGSMGEPSVVVRSPSPPAKPIVQPLPEIQITRTESNRSNINEKWVKPEKIEEEKGS